MSTSPKTLGNQKRRHTMSGRGGVRTLEFLKLSKGNYHEWALVVKVNLEAMGLLNVVESDSFERREDRMAIAAILRAVPLEMKSSIAEKKSAKEACAAVKIMRLGDERVCVRRTHRSCSSNVLYK
jgi:hypothetical protein